MTETLIGYARCSTDRQDLRAQREELAGLGVAPERIYMDKGLTGTNRARPGLDQAMAAVRKGDTLLDFLHDLGLKWAAAPGPHHRHKRGEDGVYFRDDILVMNPKVGGNPGVHRRDWCSYDLLKAGAGGTASA